MKKSQKTKILIVLTSLVLVLSLLVPKTAFADDTTPPPATEEPVVTEEPGSQTPQEPAATEEPGLQTPQEPAATEETGSQTLQEPVATEEPGSLSPQAPVETDVPTSLPEALEQLPPDTSVILTINDQIEPLATLEAQNAFVVGDPIWCPNKISPPDPGVDGCSDSYTSLWNLINALQTDSDPYISEPNVAGTIWIEEGIASGSGVTIDGSFFTTWSGVQLTLQGGWDGIGSNGISGVSTFSVPITITEWGNTVTLNQITVSGASGTGLSVLTSGNIELLDVSSSNNSGAGADLFADGNVTLTGVSFLNNHNYGVLVDSGGTIAADDLTASGNGIISGSGQGAQLVSAGGVVLTGTNTFTGNNNTGLLIDSGNTINVENVTASGNGAGNVSNYGVELYSTNAVTLTGMSLLNNRNSGLVVDTGGTIDAVNLVASGNGTGGVSGNGAELYSAGAVTLTGATFLNNRNSGLLVDSSSTINTLNLIANGNGNIGGSGYGVNLTSIAGVALTGTNIFTGNNNAGLFIDSGATIDVENLTASGNGTGAELSSAGAVTLIGASLFSGNFNSGLLVDSGGTIIAEDITASGNGIIGGSGNGAELISIGGVMLIGMNIFTGNNNAGLIIDSGSTIDIENLTADGNGAGGVSGNGAELTSVGAVALTGTNIFTGNTNSGLFVDSGAAVDIENLTASGNGAGGAFGNGAELYSADTVTLTGMSLLNNLNSGLLVDSGSTIDIQNLTASGNGTGGVSGNGAELTSVGGVVLIGTNIFTGNNNAGLFIDSGSTIDIENLTADGNGAGGVSGNGAELTSVGAVALTGTNIFTGNTNSGLFVDSGAAVDIENLTASGNGAGGAFGNGAELYSADTVTLTGMSLLNNLNSGLLVDSGSTIDIQNLTASGNGTGGVSGNGAELTSVGGVVLIGTNIFTGNNNAGLFIDSGSTIDIENLTADGNGAGGVSGNGAELTSVGAVALTGTNIFTGNTNSGLFVDSGAAVDIENLTASGNGAGGAFGNGAELYSADTVTLTGMSLLNNLNSGLLVDSGSTIDIQNLTASGNGTGGVSGNGAELTSVGGVVLIGTNIFTGNNNAGLFIDSGSTIDIENLTADGNGAGGVSGNGAELTSVGAVALTGTNIFTGNTNSGLFVDSGAAIDIENLTADGNGAGGASGQGAELYSAGAVTLIGASIFSGNFNSGLFIDSGSAIDAGDITASGNGTGGVGQGAELTSVGGVALTGTNIFTGNNNTGLFIDSGTTIDVENLTTSGNGAGGVSGSGAELTSVGGVALTGTNIFTGNNNAGLFIDSGAAIDIENLTASGNGAGGASGQGAELYSAGAVTLIGASLFSGNFNSGAFIDSGSTINAGDITASGNGTGGVLGQGAELTSVGWVALTGTNIFTGNNNTGLFIDSGATVDIENLTADGNGAGGVSGSGAELTSVGNVALTGTNIFTGNTNSGLFIDSGAAIDIENLTADGNGAGGASGHGAELTSVGGVTLTEMSLLNNFNSGLFVDSGSTINAENLAASGNGTGGAFGNGVELYSTAGVALTGTNIFTGNNNAGLFIDSGATIDVENLTASGNGTGGVFGNGAELTSVAGVVLTGTNIFTGNNNDGLYIDSGSTIDVENLAADGNGTGGVFGNGAELYSIGGVAVTGTNIFAGNTNSGLLVESGAAITVENVAASGNGTGGVYGNGVELYGTNSVTLIGMNILNENNNSGLIVESGDDIEIERLIASGNGAGGVNGVGAELYAAGDVTLSETGTFSNNFSDGLVVIADGNININNAFANFNGGNGIYLETAGEPGATLATVTCGSVLSNAGAGIKVDLPWILNLNGVRMAGNGAGNTSIINGFVNFNSNDCFAYPGIHIAPPIKPIIQELPINVVNIANGQQVELQCQTFSENIVVMPNGDRVALPCPIKGMIRLTHMTGVALPGALPSQSTFGSGLIFSILDGNQNWGTAQNSGTVWFAGTDPKKDSFLGGQFWDGTQWVDIAGGYAFATISFVIPENMKGMDLAILFWDGVKWVELSSENQYIDGGLFLKNGGRISEGGERFEASVNFAGTFVLVQK